MLHLKCKRDLKEWPQDNNLNEFLILEHYFNENIKLRLNSKDENGLKEANDISTIITSKRIVSYNNFTFTFMLNYTYIIILSFKK